MLMLSTLHTLLSQILSPPHLHTTILFTISGELVSSASEPVRPKDEVRIIVGLCTEVWQETREQGYGMVDSEFGKLIVLPIDDFSTEPGKVFSDDHHPLMLLVLNASNSVEWEELQTKGKALSIHLSKPLDQFRDHITALKPSPSSTAATSTSPAAVRL